MNELSLGLKCWKCDDSSYDIVKYDETLYDVLKYVYLRLVVNEIDMTCYICYA